VGVGDVDVALAVEPDADPGTRELDAQANRMMNRMSFM